jgi:hypothetical protein
MYGKHRIVDAISMINTFLIAQVKQQKKMAVRRYRQLEAQYGDISAKIQEQDRAKQDMRRIHQVSFQTTIIV